MINNTEIEEEFAEYNNFENYADIAKYLLLNPAKFNYIHDLIGTMEFNDIESISSSIKLVIDLLKDYNVNIFSTHVGIIFKMVHIEKSSSTGGLPEIQMSIAQDAVSLSDDDIYPFIKQNINDMIYNSLQGYNFKEINEKVSKAEINNIIYKRTMRGIKSYTKNNDLIIGKGNTIYDTPIQLIIYRIFKQGKDIFFHGKIHIIEEIIENMVLQVR